MKTILLSLRLIAICFCLTVCGSAQQNTITSLNPTSIVAGSPAFTLTINGTGFGNDAQVTWNGTSVPTTFVNATQVTAAINANLVISPGSASITVFTGGTTSNAVTFTITAAPLTLSSLSPNSTAPGGPAFTLTANGTGFATGAIVMWNGTNLPTAFINSTQLMATVGSNLIVSAGTATVTVLSGGATSNALSFSIGAPSITISSISPTSAAAGGPAFTLTVNGTGFASGAAVEWNSTFLTTTFVSSTQLTASVPASLITSAGNAAIIVVNPGGAQSTSVTFTITNGGVSITSLSPTSTIAGGPTFTLTVNGTGFVSGAAVEWNSSFLVTTFVSSSQLTATVPPGLIASAGAVTITVVNPAGSPSNSVAFNVLIPPTSQYGGFAHIAAGQGWDTAVSLTNLGNSDVTVRVRLWNDNGSPLALTIVPGSTSPGTTGALIASTYDLDIPAGASIVFDLSSTPSAVQQGWIELLAPTGSSLSGYAVFRFQSDTTASEGTSPLITANSISIAIPYDNTTFNTGIALANQSGTNPSNLSIKVLDASGNMIASDFLTLNADGHTSFLVVTRYPASAGKRGVIEITNLAQGTVNGLGFRFRPLGSFTSIPVTFR